MTTDMLIIMSLMTSIVGTKVTGKKLMERKKEEKSDKTYSSIRSRLNENCVRCVTFCVFIGGLVNSVNMSRSISATKSSGQVHLSMLGGNFISRLSPE